MKTKTQRIEALTEELDRLTVERLDLIEDRKYWEGGCDHWVQVTTELEDVEDRIADILEMSGMNALDHEGTRTLIHEKWIEIFTDYITSDGYRGGRVTGAEVKGDRTVVVDWVDSYGKQWMIVGWVNYYDTPVIDECIAIV